MIDWNEQWAHFAPNFENGYASVALENGQNVRLKAGPGFGDGSHPTTKLVLELMPPYIRGKNVVDLGCGTGILSIAASHLGARRVLGIDICNESLAHAQENAHLNGLKLNFSKILTEDLWEVILLNMISSEQKMAWSEQQALRNFQGLVISSGVLSTQRDNYLAQVSQRGWECLGVKEKDGWLGFIFQVRNRHAACRNHIPS